MKIDYIHMTSFTILHINKKFSQNFVNYSCQLNTRRKECGIIVNEVKIDYGGLKYMLCTECKKEQEKRISNEEKENAQPAEKVCSDVHTTLKSKRSAALILVTGATLMLIMVFILFWLIMLPNLPQDNSVLANNCANICQTAKEYIGI